MKPPHDLSVHFALLSEAVGEIWEWIREAERIGGPPPVGTLVKIRTAARIHHLNRQIEALQNAQKMLEAHTDVEALTASLRESIAHLQEKVEVIRAGGETRVQSPSEDLPHEEAQTPTGGDRD